MPSRNIIKEYASDSYYHVYNRGVNKRKIFIDEQDHTVYLNLLKRHLTAGVNKDKFGREYRNYHKEIELLAFCLMPNHFHLLIYQYDNPTALTELMRSILTAYTMYFNKKYRRVGHLFQERYKASRVSQDNYLEHISRYIHLNPRSFETYEWSSLPYYLGTKRADWILPNKILELFNGDNYLKFVNDYKDHKAMLDELKNDLADR